MRAALPVPVEATTALLSSATDAALSTQQEQWGVQQADMGGHYAWSTPPTSGPLSKLDEYLADPSSYHTAMHDLANLDPHHNAMREQDSSLVAAAAVSVSSSSSGRSGDISDGLTIDLINHSAMRDLDISHWVAAGGIGSPSCCNREDARISNGIDSDLNHDGSSSKGEDNVRAHSGVHMGDSASKLLDVRAGIWKVPAAAGSSCDAAVHGVDAGGDAGQLDRSSLHDGVVDGVRSNF